jgi:hypothetical protein
MKNKPKSPVELSYSKESSLKVSVLNNKKYKTIFVVKSRYNELDDYDKELLLRELWMWVDQEINNLYPEQE